MNPSAPSFKGLIKIHKPDQPIRPVVNWRKAPAYNLSKMFTKTINQLTPLPYAFNILNTQDLMQNIKDTPMLPHYTLASLDITNLYSNIPIIDTKMILNDMLIHEFIEHYRKTTHPQNSHPRPILSIRCIQTHLPWLQQGLCRTNWKAVLHEVQGAQNRLPKQQPILQLCQTS